MWNAGRARYFWGMRPGSSTAYQLYKLGSFGSTLLFSMFMAHWLGRGEQLDAYETALLYVGGFSAPLGYALGQVFQQGYLPHSRLLPHWQLGSLWGLVAGLAVGLGLWLSRSLSLQLVYPSAVLAFALTAGLQLELYILKRRPPHSLLIFASWYHGGYFLACLLPVYLWQDLGASLWAAAGVALLRYLILTRLLWQDPAAPRQRATEQLWPLFWPVLGAGLLGIGARYFDGFLIRYADPDHFVLFRYASRELPLSVLLASSLSAYWAGRVADVGGITPQHTLAMRRASTRLMHQVFPLSILLVLLAPLLYRLLYGPQFTEAAGVFSLYLLLVIPRCLLPQALLVGLRLNALLLRIALWELLLHLALSLLLVHTLGYAGAAWATLAAYSLEKILLVHHARRRGVRLRQYLSIRTWLLYSLALVLSWGASWLFFS